MGTSVGYSCRVPENFKGKYQVQFEFDAGPFEIENDRNWFVID